MPAVQEPSQATSRGSTHNKPVLGADEPETLALQGDVRRLLVLEALLRPLGEGGEVQKEACLEVVLGNPLLVCLPAELRESEEHEADKQDGACARYGTGARTTVISGAWVALHDLLTHMDRRRVPRDWPLVSQLGAVSVGVVDGTPLCDLDYKEDKDAEVDMNLVMTGEGAFVEVQGSAEGGVFAREMLDAMLDLGAAGIERIFELQRAALEG